MTKVSGWLLAKSLVGSFLLLMLTAGDLFAEPRDRLLYRLPAVVSNEMVESKEIRLTYQTVAGFPRTVKLAVRFPTGSIHRPTPTVIWAHGGGEQPNGRPADTVLPEWGETTARAGYLSINVLHGTNVGAERSDLCRAVGFQLPADPATLAEAFNIIVAGMGAAAASGASPAIDVDTLAARYPALFADLAQFRDDERLVERVVEQMTAWLTGCQAINGLGLWDRPHDIEAVVNALHDDAIPELAGWVNLQKIAVAGHSNGTNSVLNAVGLRRALPNGVKVDAPFPPPVRPQRPWHRPTRRPVAAIALSPMGVNNYGLYDTAATTANEVDPADHSWIGLSDLPVLTLTGDGDNHCKPSRFVCNGSDSTGKRVIPFFRMPAGDKYLMLVSDARSPAIVSSHERFGRLEHAACPTGKVAQCRATERWIKSTVIAFLDAYLRGFPHARQWLNSDRLLRASEGLADIHHK